MALDTPAAVSHGVGMLSETQNHFSLTRAALSTCAHPKKEFLISISNPSGGTDAVQPVKNAKTMKIVLGVMLALSGLAPSIVQAGTGFSYPSDRPEPDVIRSMEQMDRQRKMRAALRESLWRVVDGLTESVLAPGWYQFEGKVVDVSSSGIRVDGAFYTLLGETNGEGRDFWVANFPFPVADGQHLERTNFYAARRAGMYSYPTVASSRRTIPKFDFGEIVKPPAPVARTAEQIAEARKKREERVRAQAPAVFRFYMEQTADGSAFAERRVGEMYRDGKGVAQDLAQARLWLQKAAAHGDKEAEQALKALLEQSAPR